MVTVCKTQLFKSDTSPYARFMTNYEGSLGNT